jgi:hypothetical protein
MGTAQLNTVSKERLVVRQQFHQGGQSDADDTGPVAATYAIAALHGEVTLLTCLLQQLAPGPEDTLIFLGDYLDRGEDALATILAGGISAADPPLL